MSIGAGPPEIQLRLHAGRPGAGRPGRDPDEAAAGHEDGGRVGDEAVERVGEPGVRDGAASHRRVREDEGHARRGGVEGIAARRAALEARRGEVLAGGGERTIVEVAAV